MSTTAYSDSMVELSADLSETFGVNRPIESVDGEDIDLGAAPVLFKPIGLPGAARGERQVR